MKWKILILMLFGMVLLSVNVFSFSPNITTWLQSDYTGDTSGFNTNVAGASRWCINITFKDNLH